MELRQARSVKGRGAIVALLAVVTLLLLAAWRLARPHVLHAYDAAPVMRLHVVPHSDAPADQDLKLAVRDAVLPFVLELVGQADSSAQAHQRLLAAREVIAAEAQAVVQEWGARYPVAVVGQWDDAGNPVAVRIVIGAGQGSNWFCVLFPPLCFAGETDAVQLSAPARAAPAHPDGPGALSPATVPAESRWSAAPGEPSSPALTGDGPDGPVRVAFRWLDWLPGLSSLLFDGVGQVDQNDVDPDFAHALPRDGHIGPAPK